MTTNDVSDTGPAQNTDREIWREVDGDAYAPSIHVTQSGGIGIDVGGLVVVLPVREWHALASRQPTPVAPVPVTITDAARERAAQAIYERGPSIGGDTEDGWSAQSNDYKRKAREIANAALSALSVKPGEQG